MVVFDLWNIFENCPAVLEKITIEVLNTLLQVWLEVYGKMSSIFKSNFGHFSRRVIIHNIHENAA